MSQSLSITYEDIMSIHLKIFRLFGIYHKKSDHIGFKCYQISILVVLWLNLIKFLSVFNFFRGGNDDISIYLLFKIGFLITLLIEPVYGLHFFFNQELNSRERELIRNFNHIYHSYSNRFDGLDKLKRSNFYLIGTYSILAMFNSIIWYLSILGPSTFYGIFNLMLTPLHEQSADTIPLLYKLVVFSLGVLICFYWNLSNSYFLIQCNLIINLIDQFNKSYEGFVNGSIIVSRNDQIRSNAHINNWLDYADVNNPTTRERVYESEDKIDYYRSWYLKLINLIKTFDECYKKFMAFTIILYLIIILILIYTLQLINKDCKIMFKIIFPIWLVVSIGLFGHILIQAAHIHVKVSYSFFLLIEPRIEKKYVFKLET